MNYKCATENLSYVIHCELWTQISRISSQFFFQSSWLLFQIARWTVFILPVHTTPPEDPWRGTKPSSHTKPIDSFGAPPFNLFAPFHLNDVTVHQGEREGGVIQPRRRGRGRYRRVLKPHHRALGNHLVGGLCETFYQFFMPIPLDVTPLRAFYAPDSSAQENMLPLW